MSKTMILFCAEMLLLIIGVSIGMGEEVQSLSLSEAVGLALEKNRKLGSVRHERLAASIAKWEAYSAWLPQISFNSQASKSESDRMNFNIDPTKLPPALAGLENLFDSSKFGLGASYVNKFQLGQLIFDRSVLGAIFLSRLRDQAAQWQEKGQEQQVVYETVGAYLDILRGQELLAVQKQRLELADKQLETAQTNFEVGLRIRTDVLRAQLTRSSALRDVVSAEIALEKAQVVLNQILGIPMTDKHKFEGGSLVTYNPTLDLVTRLQDYEDLFQLAEKQHPAIQVAHLVVQQNEEAVNMARGEFLPRATVGGSWGYNEGGGINFKQEDWSIQAAIQIPIFEGGRKIAKVQRTKEQLEAERQRFENAVRITHSLVEQSALALKEEQRNLEIAVEASSVAEESYNRFKNLYDEGLADSLDLTQALTELVTARTNVVSTRYGYLRVYVQLLFSLGTISADPTQYAGIEWLTTFSEGITKEEKPQVKPVIRSEMRSEKKVKK